MVTRQPVPAFDHRRAGTSERVWSDSETLRSTPRFDLGSTTQLVVLAAHPDDETLGAGGLMAIATRCGIPVTVVVATMGERSHPESRTHSPHALASRRRVELVQALGELAPTATLRMLGLPDGDLAGHRDALFAALRPLVRGASTLVLAPWSADGHPDHAAAGEAAEALIAGTGTRLLQYPIWAWHWAHPADLPDGLVRVDLEPEDASRKHAALQCHQSQIEPLSELTGDEAILPPAFAEHFERSYEIFVTVDPVTRSLEQLDERSLKQEFFDDFYGSDTDPWGFESRWYETRKRAVTMAALPRQRFRSAFEPGCSIGVLTAELATRCDRLLATDISERPLVTARRRLRDRPEVSFEQRRVPQEWPTGDFDLIVLSEVGYYCGPADLRVLASTAAAALSDDGVLLACHWRHSVGEYPLRGDDVHRVLTAEPGLALLVEHIEEDFILQVFMRPPAVSVASATGLRS